MRHNVHTQPIREVGLLSGAVQTAAPSQLPQVAKDVRSF
jgi:hypothetical protein